MDKYCILPFVSLRIEDTENINSMGIRPCCNYRSDSTLVFDSIDQYLDSDFLKQLQQHFLTQDTLPVGCQKCQDTENKKLLSIRQQKNKFFKEQYVTETTIKELDLFPSNTCNLTCVMCSPKFSSAIGSESKKFGIIDKVYNFDITKEISASVTDFKSPIEYATIAGGEFFYTKNRYLLLDSLLKNNPKINLKITSNASIYDSKTVEILSKFDNLVLRFSIDSLDDNYDIIRYPAQWKEIEKNIIAYKNNLPNARIELVMVTQPLGIFKIFDWFEFANRNNFETHWNPFYGDNFSWKILSNEEKQSVSDWLLDQVNKCELEPKQKIYVINFAKNFLPNESYSPQIRYSTLEKLHKLMSHRNMDPEKIKMVIKNWPALLDDFLNIETKVDF